MQKILWGLMLIGCSILGWTQEAVLYEESFDYKDGALPKDWWSEGNCAVVKNNHLYVNANEKEHRCATVWLNRVFEGDLQIEYDVQFVASSDNANNNNFFFLFSPSGDEDIYKTCDQREDGNYSRYHELNGYIFTHVLNNEYRSRFRFRDCPGFHLLKESFAEKSIFGKTYRVSIGKVGNRIKYKTDGKTIFDVKDVQKNPVHSKGLIGFRTWHTELWWDNLIVKRINPVSTSSMPIDLTRHRNRFP